MEKGRKCILPLMFDCRDTEPVCSKQNQKNMNLKKKTNTSCCWWVSMWFNIWIFVSGKSEDLCRFDKKYKRQKKERQRKIREREWTEKTRVSVSVFLSKAKHIFLLHSEMNYVPFITWQLDLMVHCPLIPYNNRGLTQTRSHKDSELGKRLTQTC